MLRGRNHQQGIAFAEIGEIAGRADRLGLSGTPLQEDRIFVALG